MASDVKYPDVTVQLSGMDGNAFAIMGRVTKALRRAGVSQKELDLYVSQSMAMAYNELVQTAMRWVNVE